MPTPNQRGKRGGGSAGRGSALRRPTASQALRGSASPTAVGNQRLKKYKPKNIIEEDDDEAPQPPLVKKTKSTASTGAKKSTPTRSAPSAASPTPSQEKPKKRSNGALILHHLAAMNESPSGSPAPPQRSSSQRQVHYKSLPMSLRDEDSLRELLKPFGKIDSIDMNYVGRGALVTFSSPAAATKALSGALLPNGRPLTGAHPEVVQSNGPTQKGRNFQNPSSSEPGLRPALGRHNMDEEYDGEEEDVPVKKSKKRVMPPEDEDQFSDEDQAAPAAKRKPSKKTIDLQDDGDYDSQFPPLTRANATTNKAKELKPTKLRLANGLGAAAPSVLQRALSGTSRWNQAAKVVPTTFRKFGTTSSAMDIDDSILETQEEDEPSTPLKNRPTGHFSQFEPLQTQASLEPGVIEAHQNSGVPGRPQPVNPDMVRQISATLKEDAEADLEEIDEEDNSTGYDDDEENDIEPTQTSSQAKGGSIFSRIQAQDDFSDFDSHDEASNENGAEEHEEHEEKEEEEDDHQEDASDSPARSDLGSDKGGDFNDSDQDEVQHYDSDDVILDDEQSEPEDSRSEPSAPPQPIKKTLPMPDLLSVRAVPAAPSTRTASKLQAKTIKLSGSLESLTQPLNPYANPAYLQSKFDADKHIWAAIEESNPEKAVSSFQRPAGGDDIPPPERVRPVRVLFDALLQIDANGDGLPASSLLDYYNYILNRYRQILKEMTQQSTMCLLSCYIAETIARRALAMKAELLIKNFDTDEAFDTAREKVLDNAFEMCKNIYTFHTRNNLRSPFAYEILSYYLLYRLRDGPTTACPMFLDSLASVFYCPSTQKPLASTPAFPNGKFSRSAHQSEYLAKVRQHPSFDFVTHVIEHMKSNNWSALRNLALESTFLQCCALADLMPEFNYYAIRYCFAGLYRSPQGPWPALPAAYVQFSFCVPASALITALQALGYGSRGNYVEVVNMKSPKDTLYPINKRGVLTLATDKDFWDENRPQILKILTNLPSTFLYNDAAPRPLDPNIALRVYQRWAKQNLFNNPQSEYADFGTIAAQVSEESLTQPLQAESSYIIPEDINRVSAVYQRAIERSLGLSKSEPSVIIHPTVAPKPKLPPPPPPKKASTLQVPSMLSAPNTVTEASEVTIPKIAPLIKQSAMPPTAATKSLLSGLLGQTSTASTSSSTKSITASSTTSSPTAPGSTNSVIPPKFSTHKTAEVVVFDDDAKSCTPSPVPSLQADPAFSRGSSPTSSQSAQVTEAQIDAIKKQLQEDFAKELKRKEEEMISRVQQMLEAEKELKRLTDEAQQRLHYLSHTDQSSNSITPAKSKAIKPSTPVKPSFQILTPPLEIGPIVGPHIAGQDIESVLNARVSSVHSFKMLLSLPNNAEPSNDDPLACFVESQLSGPDMLSEIFGTSSCTKVLTRIRYQTDLSRSNPFNDNIEWVSQLPSPPTNPPLVAAVIQRLSLDPITLMEHHPEDMKRALRGTQGLLFYLPEANVQADGIFWESHRLRLYSTLACLSPSSRIPLMVIYPSCASKTATQEENIKELVHLQLGLDSLLSGPSSDSPGRLSHALVLPLLSKDPNTDAQIDIATIVGQAQVSKQLEHIIASFAMLPQPKPSIGTSSLSSLLASPVESLLSALASSYRQQIDSHSATLQTIGEAHLLAPGSTETAELSCPLEDIPAPIHFAEQWNQLLSDLASLVSSEALLSVDWPVPETLALFPHVSSFGWPAEDWNDWTRLENIRAGLESLCLSVPQAPELASPIYDTSPIQKIVETIISQNAPLAGSEEHAQYALAKFEERFSAAKKVARKTDHVPVPVPFPWHSLFEIFFTYLLEQLDYVVGVQEEVIPTKQDLLHLQQSRRDRQLNESNGWTSWYQELCPTLESIREKQMRARRQVTSANFSDALLRQFSSSGPSAAPTTPSTTSSSSHKSRLRFSEDVIPPPVSSVTPRAGSSISTVTAATPSNPSVDSLHDRLKSLQARLSKIGSPLTLDARQNSNKRQSNDREMFMEAPAPKRQTLL